MLSDADKIRAKHGTYYQVIARLAPGVRIDAAENELKAIQTELAKAYADPYEREQVNSVQLQQYGDSLVEGNVRKSLLALSAAASMLWLIACVNVTSLLLARATARQREIAVRGALGASGLSIVQQLLIEGLVLSVTASLLGVLLVTVTLRLFEHGLTTQYENGTKCFCGRSFACSNGTQRAGVIRLARYYSS